MFSVTSCYAGVDFSMSGKPVIPDFSTTQEAVDWANKVKWVEPIRRQLKHKIEDIRLQVANLDLSNKEGTDEAAVLMEKREYYKQALNVIELYKSKGVVGTSIYIGVTP